MSSPKRIVVALGGNAISDPATPGTIPQQFAQTRETAVHLVGLIKAGYQLLVTHGNGPQVGNILRRVELAASEVYPIDLGLCVADSQAGMGYMICQCLANELMKHGRKRYPVTIVTTVLFDRADPAFLNPTKPIGIYYSKEQAEEHRTKDGWVVKEIKGKGWRRVVPSPMPLRVMELDTIRKLYESGELIVAGGGGGIPIVWTEGWGYEGLEAVIDKDLTSALLADGLNADVLLIITGEDAAYENFGSPQARRLDRLTAPEAQRFLDDGQFPAGSMGPKIEAGIKFVSANPTATRRAVITSCEMISEALAGRAGTRITGNL